MLRVDGHTPAGLHVRVEQDDHPLDVRIEIDGEHVAQTRRPTLYRDGGTQRFYTERGDLVFPHRLGDPDRTPRLDGEPIV